MGHYILKDVQQIAEAIRYGGEARRYHPLRQALPTETTPQIATDRTTDGSDDREWPEFYKAMDMAG